MKRTIKKPLQFVAVLLPLMTIGSFFTGIYSFSTYTADMQNDMIAQIGSYELLLLVGTVQSVLYASVAGFLPLESSQWNETEAGQKNESQNRAASDNAQMQTDNPDMPTRVIENGTEIKSSCSMVLIHGDIRKLEKLMINPIMPVENLSQIR